VCQEPECQQIATLIRDAIDTDTPPCKDFFKFSCGNWVRKHPIPRSYNDFSTFTKVSKDIEDQLRELLETPSYIETLPENQALRKAKDFYRSCMDTKTIERLGTRPLMKLIRQLGSWSLCNDKSWNKEKWDAYDVLRKLQSTYYPASPFFSVEVTNDHLNSTRHLIKVDQSGLSLQREIYFKHPEMVDTYVEYMAKVATLLGIKGNATKEMRKIVDFETKLANITTSAEDKADGIYRRIKLHHLIKLVPGFPWLKHMQAIFRGAHVTDADVVLATPSTYLSKMNDIIKETPKELLSNYVVWQMIRDKISLLSKPFRKARAVFNHKISGVKEQEPRWRTCTSITNDNLGVPLGTLYVRKYFNESTVGKIQLMIQEIKDTFKERVKEHEWIDDKTTQYVFQKADALRSKIGYANYVLRPIILKKRFKSLKIGKKTFFSNNVNVDKWVRHRLVGKLRKAVDKEKWPMFPQTINAMYQFYENEIGGGRGCLRRVFLALALALSLSYGAVGSIIGHEMTHGFDNTGRKFDKNGDIVQEWWSKSSLTNFKNRAQCIADQYSKFKIQNKYPLSGVVTLDENIADNGGTKLSYNAYHRWLKDNGNQEQVLPGLKYTNEQLFFIGYAQEYCSHARPKTEYIASLSDIHSPPKFRVIGTLSNMEEFSDAFKCPPGSPMNPKKKCEVW
ncbi:predicted protein, partial [Nematostella vectensis]